MRRTLLEPRLEPAVWLWSRPGPLCGERWEGSTGLGLNLRGHPPPALAPLQAGCWDTEPKAETAIAGEANLRKGSSGLADEINFEDFLTIMSYFRPIDTTMDEEQVQLCRKEKLRFLFHMYDSDSDGRITLEEYRNVKYAPPPAGQGSWPLPAPGPDGGPRSPCVYLTRQVVEELLSGNPHIEKESARSIADGAMMEAASVCVGQMEPDQVYEGITFDDFLKIWQGIDIETKMHVRFLNMETIALCH
ncbi:hypothetical protein GH733_005254 [Mirounga leonina]|nr:hypothetical protein GH733_005254 [Mirounga leonina]